MEDFHWRSSACLTPLGNIIWLNTRLKPICPSEINNFYPITSRALFDIYGDLDQNELWYTDGY